MNIEDIVIIDNIDNLNEKIVNNKDYLDKLSSKLNESITDNADKIASTSETISKINKSNKNMYQEILTLIDNQSKIMQNLENNNTILSNQLEKYEKKILNLEKKNEKLLIKIEGINRNFSDEILFLKEKNRDRFYKIYDEIDEIHILHAEKDNKINVEIKKLNEETQFLDLNIKDTAIYLKKKLSSIEDNIEKQNNVDKKNITDIKDHLHDIDDNIYLIHKKSEISKTILENFDTKAEEEV